MIEFIKTFEGIIGTIIGVILGSVITIISKRSGKISCYTNSVIMGYEIAESGALRDVNKKEFPEYGSINIDLDIYNGTDLQKVIRDIRLNFKSVDSEFNTEINDLSTFQLINSSPYYEPLTFINLPARKLIKFNLGVSFKKKELNEVLNKKIKVTLVGSKPKFFFNKFYHFITKLDRGEIVK